jgi:hypothetical protein
MYSPALRLILSLVLIVGMVVRAMAGEDTNSAPVTTPSSSPTPSTPATSAAKVFDALDLTLPELAAVKTAWDHKDIAGATKAFAAYLRTRKNVRWNPDATKAIEPPFFNSALQAADYTARGKIVMKGFNFEYTFPDGKIDWHYNATAHMPGQAFNGEWSTELNRMAAWGYLSYGYRAKHDEKYAQAYVQQVRSFIDQCPVPDHNGNKAGGPWSTIDAGIRMTWNWPGPFLVFLHSPSMSDDDAVAIAGSFLDHARYLRQFNTSFNILIMEMCGLYSVGSFFPEFKEAAEWRDYAAKRMIAEEQNQFLPDGSSVELSTNYQNVSLLNILHLAKIAEWNGRQADLPTDYLRQIEKAYDWQLNIMAPDRTIPAINDAGTSGTLSILPILKDAFNNFPDRRDFLWILSDGKKGNPPAATSTFMDWSGLVAMRSGWERDANYALFRVGPLGANHVHQDNLEVLLWAYGRPLLFNGGGGTYEKSKWRSWAVSTSAANCLLVDGLDQMRDNAEANGVGFNLHPTTGPDAHLDPNQISPKTIDAGWQSTPAFDFASGTYDFGYGPKDLPLASQRRDVLFLKPDIFIVADHVVPHDTQPHRYQARWQLKTTQTELDPATGILVTTDPDLPNVVVAPLLKAGTTVAAVSGQEYPEILGWDIEGARNPPRVPATTVQQTREGAGPQLFLSLFLPLRAKEANPIAKITAGPDAQSATVVFNDGRQIVVSAPSGGGISAHETLPNGNAGRTADASGRSGMVIDK